MEFVSISRLLIVWLGVTVYQSDAACPDSWKEYKGKCYFITKIRHQFTDAEISCSSRNATIFVFHSEDEWNWMKSQIIHGPRTEYWIGLQRVNQTWEWMDDTTYEQNATYIKWYRNKVGERDEPRHRCASMLTYSSYAGEIHQQDCYMTWPTVCVRTKDAYELCDTADGWQLHENKCFKFYNDKATWFDANVTCTKNEATLFRSETRRELVSIGDILKCTTMDNQFWIDVSDVSFPGHFMYSDNTTIRHNFWYANAKEIKEKGGTCVYSNPLASYFWMTELCTEEKKFMCTKPTGTCPNGWAQYGYECYQLVSVLALQDTWFGAKTFCENQNAQLLSINDANEESFVKNIMLSQQVQVVWLGFSDTEQPDFLTWTDGSLVSLKYQNWDFNFPKLTKNRTDCGRLQAGERSSAWANGYCFSTLPFICKTTILNNTKPKPTQAPTKHCDPGWILYNENCYYFGTSHNTSGYNWTQARRFCFAARGDLTTIIDPMEQDFFNGNLLSTGTYWIGLRFSTIHKKLKWVDLTDPTFLNFLPGDPDDIKKGEDCVQIVGERPDYDGAWNTVNCSTKQSFICKKAAYPGVFNTITVPPVAVGSLSNACGPQWIYNSLDSFCYQVVLYKPKTFADAQWACQQMGGNLASITGPREQRFIQAILSTEQYQREAKNFWIGGSDGTREGGWGWIDGSPFAYLNWHPGQPNDLRDSPLGQDCAEMVAIWNYQWNDNRCDTEQYYICKKPAMPLTTTVLTPRAGPVDTCVSEAMISGNYSLLDGDKALTASTSKDAHGPFNSRLFYHGANKMGWSPKRSTQSEYIQAYFYNIINFKGIITAGNAIGAEWVTSYRLRYQYSSFSEWVWYEEPPGKTKIFTGNSDNVTPVTNEIKFPFKAKYIRLYPATWYGHVSLRWEILGCVHEFCLADYAISGPLIAPDIALTASTSVDNQHLPSLSRLRPISPQTPVSCWKPNLTDKSAYIQVDIGSIQIIRGITVAGNPNAQEWVSSFKVLYGIKYNKVTSYYQEPYHTVKIFSGNVNNNETVTYYFKGHFQARFIRIVPESYHVAIALRFDVMVCPQGCNQRTLFDEVNDDQFSASSSANKGSFSPSQSRLNTGRTWQPSKNNNQTQWIQIFPGNFDDSSVRKVYLESPFVARFIRIYPINYHKKMSLRWEIYGCPGPDSGRLIGCYADDGLSRDLPFEPYADPFVGMWPPMCIHHCFTKGYYYAGLQNRYLCYCGNSYGKYGSSKSCNQPCFYRPHYRCGGRRANSVYTTGLSPVTKICPPKWKEYQDKCYLLVFNMSTWIKARQDCRVMGSDLVTVNSQTEQDLVYSLMSNNFSAIFGFSGGGGGGVIGTKRTNISAPRKREGASDVWIGLNDKQEQNYFEWVNGELTKYTNWNVNQPAIFNGVKENCVLINRTNGGWQDQNCDDKHHYLCMRAKMGSSKPTQHPQFPGCDIGWVGFRQSCYLFMDQVRVFLGAKFTCRGMGATLVQVDDRFEQAFLSSILSQKYIGLYWTDATDSKGTGTFVYSNFGFIKNVMYTNWAPGRPGSGPSCVAMQTKTSAGLWVDSNCTTLAGAVCEKLGQGKTTPKPSITTPAPVPCPKGWYEINNYCYQVNNVTSSKGLSYMDADKDCRSQGASLASFHNSSDFNYLWRNYIVGADGNFWIGINALTLVNKQRKYTWTDRTPVNYVNWAPGQPDYNKGRGDCGEVVTRSGLWNDNICSFHRNWICKIRKGGMFYNTTEEHQTSTKTPTDVHPTEGTASTVNGTIPFISQITLQTTRVSQTIQYTGPMTSPQTSPKSHVLTTGGIIGVVTAVIIVLALPTIGIILWRKKKSWTSGSMGFDNFTYRNDGGILTCQENTETNS